MVDLVHLAGRAILEVYTDPEALLGISRKADLTPLTEADLRAHHVIATGLQTLTPGVRIVSEEGGADPPKAPTDDPFWLVDPLDGTKEFLKRTGEFTVNVALIRDGSPVAGIVHSPILGRTWLGAPHGAEIREGGRIHPIGVRKGDLSRIQIVASRDHSGPTVRTLVEKIPGAKVVTMGSSLKFCLIAEGRADLYLRDRPTMEWDTAAAQAVLTRAGGTVLTLDGTLLTYGKDGLRNPSFVALGGMGVSWEKLAHLLGDGGGD